MWHTQNEDTTALSLCLEAKFYFYFWDIIKCWKITARISENSPQIAETGKTTKNTKNNESAISKK